ncbi:hypothetical protein PTTG_02265 [Puccinia triticina 1-1 BBBD Race 1]|uniref:Peptidase A2 domain-containing protein n=1 Tax=Puccinia triticina (isolate 1-1 / race 1 (BBBD)) TaxID=630390 RepID=A0A180G4P3_PUCT1|nr:hypothetical protein PTTG_02265 [Puccinia triticina 1-1 BBBD Race 1]
MADPISGPANRMMVKIKPQNKSLCFDGTDVEEFLDFYELAAQLDGASEYDMARQLGCFVQAGEIFSIVKTLDGFKPPEWPKLKEAMIAYWGEVDTALFTERDLDALVETWVAKGGVSSVLEYQAFRKSWEPIQSYLVSKKHIDSEEELRKKYYQAFSAGFQERIRAQLIKDKSMVAIKAAVTEVIVTQTALKFEDSRSTAPVPSPFKVANETMIKMEADRRPKEAPLQPTAPATVDDLLRMLQSFEQRLKQELSTGAPRPTTPSGSRGPLVCYYCHREGHGTARCFELKKDKDEKLVEQKGTNFFLPKGALIPFDSSRPIRHVVASYQPKTNVVETEFRTTCGALDPWYPPAVSSQSFSGTYQSDPARKKHEGPNPYKAPAVPPSAAKRPVRKPCSQSPGSEPDEMNEEPELFEQNPASLPQDPVVADSAPSAPAAKAEAGNPRVRFERGITKDHPNAANGVLKKIGDLPVPTLMVAELFAISPAVADGMKKWVSRRRVEVGAGELKGNVAPLVDSGSQLNLISDAQAMKLHLSPRVNFSSAVYGIGNQACKLVGVAEDVPIRIGKSIVGTCHFWITRMDGPIILGRPFLMDFDVTLDFSGQTGEKILIPDAAGRRIKLSLCSVDSGRWERNFPGNGRKAVLTRKGKAREDPIEGRHFL